MILFSGEDGSDRDALVFLGYDDVTESGEGSDVDSNEMNFKLNGFFFFLWSFTVGVISTWEQRLDCLARTHGKQLGSMCCRKESAS